MRFYRTLNQIRSQNQILFGAFYIVCLGYLGIRDLRTRTVPNYFVLPMTVAVILTYPWIMPESSDRIFHGYIQTISGWGFCVVWMTLAASLRPRDVGAGDIKLAGLVGAVIGMPLAPLALGFGVFSGGVYALTVVVTGLKDKRESMAYGVALVIGGYAVMAFKCFLSMI